MDRETILNKVIQAIHDVMGLDTDDITEESVLADLSADSLDRIELVTTLEEEFDTMVDDEKLAEIKTVGDCVDAIMEALN